MRLRRLRNNRQCRAAAARLDQQLLSCAGIGSTASLGSCTEAGNSIVHVIAFDYHGPKSNHAMSMGVVAVALYSGTVNTPQKAKETTSVRKSKGKLARA